MSTAAADSSWLPNSYAGGVSPLAAAAAGPTEAAMLGSWQEQLWEILSLKASEASVGKQASQSQVGQQSFQSNR